MAKADTWLKPGRDPRTRKPNQTKNLPLYLGSTRTRIKCFSKTSTTSNQDQNCRTNGLGRANFEISNRVVPGEKFSHFEQNLTRAKNDVRGSDQSGILLPKGEKFRLPNLKLEHNGPNIEFVGDIAVEKNKDENNAVAFRASTIGFNKKGNHIINPSPDDLDDDRISG